MIFVPLLQAFAQIGTLKSTTIQQQANPPYSTFTVSKHSHQITTKWSMQFSATMGNSCNTRKSRKKHTNTANKKTKQLKIPENVKIYMPGWQMLGERPKGQGLLEKKGLQTYVILLRKLVLSRFACFLKGFNKSQACFWRAFRSPLQSYMGLHTIQQLDILRWILCCTLPFSSI